MWNKRCFTILLVFVAIFMFSSCSNIRLLQTNDDDVTKKTPTVSDTDDNTVCSTSISSPSLSSLQTTIDEANVCLSVVQTADSSLSAASDAIQYLRQIAVQGGSGMFTPADYTDLNNAFTEAVLTLQSAIESSQYEGTLLLTSDPTVFKYALLGTSVECIDTADISMTEILADVQALSTLDQPSSQNSQIVLDRVIGELNQVRSTVGLIANRVQQDITQASELKTIVAMPPAPDICNLVYFVASSGIKNIERVLDVTRQTFASFSQLNADVSKVGYGDYTAKIFTELSAAIDHSLTLSSIDGVPIFKGSNKYTDSCFGGKIYDFRASALNIDGLAASTQTEMIATVQKLDVAIATLEGKKVELGISEADVDFAVVMDEYNRLEAYQIEHPEDTCAAYNMSVEQMALSSGKVVKRDKTLSALNKMTEPLSNNLNASNQAANDCIGVIQTADGGLSEIASIVSRMREITIQSASGSASAAEMSSLQVEFVSLTSDITSVQDALTYNGKKILSGGNNLFKYFSNKIVATCLNLEEFDVSTIPTALQGLSIATQAGAQASLLVIDQVLQELISIRAQAGAYQNRLGFEINLYQTLAGAAMTSIGRGPVYFDLSVIDMAKGGVSVIQSALQRMVELAAQAAMVEDPDRVIMQKEIVELLKFIDIANITVHVNKNALISGDSVFKDTYFAGNSFDLRTSTLGIHAIDISTAVGAAEASTLLDAASSEVASTMAVLENLTL